MCNDRKWLASVAAYRVQTSKFVYDLVRQQNIVLERSFARPKISEWRPYVGDSASVQQYVAITGDAVVMLTFVCTQVHRATVRGQNGTVAARLTCQVHEGEMTRLIRKRMKRDPSATGRHKPRSHGLRRRSAMRRAAPRRRARRALSCIL